MEGLAKRLAKEQAVNVQTYLISDSSFDAVEMLYDALPETKKSSTAYASKRSVEGNLKKRSRVFEICREKISTVGTSDIITLMIGAR